MCLELTPAPVSWRMLSSWGLLAKILRMFECQCWPQAFRVWSSRNSRHKVSYQSLLMYLMVPPPPTCFGDEEKDPVIHQEEPRCAPELFSEHIDGAVLW